MKSKLLFLLGAMLSFALVQAQYSDGVALSHFSPLSTITTNPSSIAASGAYMDIQLLHVGATAVNNVVFFSKDRFNLGDVMNGTQTDFEPVIKRTVDQGMAQVNVDVRGFGFMMNVKKFAFGLNTRVRSVTSVRNIQPHLVIYAEEGLDYAPLLGQRHETRNLRINHMTWAEIGLTGAGILHQRGNTMITGGLSIKRIFSPGAAHVELKEWDFTVVDTTSLITERLSGNISAASVNTDGSETGLAALGQGWGFDFGATYYRMNGNVDNYIPHDPSSGCRRRDYDWKLGVALIDVGFANFNDNTYTLDINSQDQLDWQDWDDFDPDDQEDVENELNTVFNAQTNGDQGPLTFRLPTVFSVTFDKRIAQPFSLGLMWQQAMPRRSALGPQGNTQLAVVPRLEWKRVEFAMPMRLHEYRFPQLGMALRLNGVVIGSDKIGASLFGGNHNGADIYLSLKHTIYKNFRCPKPKKSKGFRGRSGVGGRTVPCPKW